MPFLPPNQQRHSTEGHSLINQSINNRLSGAMWCAAAGWQKSNTSSAAESSPYLPSKNHTQGAVFVVHRQPIALHRLTVHDVRPDLAGKHSRDRSYSRDYRFGFPPGMQPSMIRCLSQARTNWEGCDRKGIRL